MYYPYFFSNKSELEVIFKLKKEIDRDMILPIIEPYTVSQVTVKGISKIIKSDTKFILIINPFSKRSKTKDQLDVETIIESLQNHKSSKIIIGLNVEATTLEYCMNFIQNHQDREIALFHKNIQDIKNVIEILKNKNVKYNFFSGNASKNDYCQNFNKTKKIILQNAFIKITPNSKYKEHIDEEFYKLHKEYKILGFDGFGDYLTIGDNPSDSLGRTPSSVVIHYTYPETNNSQYIRIRRFIGDIDKEHEILKDGILKAMDQAKEFLSTHTISYCTLCEECNDLLQKTSKRDTYTLGEIKKFSMLHHVYMILKLIY